MDASGALEILRKFVPTGLTADVAVRNDTLPKLDARSRMSATSAARGMEILSTIIVIGAVISGDFSATAVTQR